MALACSSVMPALAKIFDAVALVTQLSIGGCAVPGFWRTTSNMVLVFEFLTVFQP